MPLSRGRPTKLARRDESKRLRRLAAMAEKERNGAMLYLMAIVKQCGGTFILTEEAIRGVGKTTRLDIKTSSRHENVTLTVLEPAIDALINGPADVSTAGSEPPA